MVTYLCGAVNKKLLTPFARNVILKTALTSLQRRSYFRGKFGDIEVEE
jgi:hypothetical protein